MKYDPDRQVDAETWNAAHDDDKIDAVLRYHRAERHPLPKDRARAHALFHIVIENQIAMGDRYIAKSVLDRLVNEGTDRHQAVHAMASVLSEHFYNPSEWTGPHSEFGAAYTAKLTELTARAWREKYRDMLAPAGKDR